MASNAVWLRRDATNVCSGKMLDSSEEILFAITDSFVLAKDLAWAELRTLISTYCDEHDDAMTALWTARQGDNKAAPLKPNSFNTPETPLCLLGKIEKKRRRGIYAAHEGFAQAAGLVLKQDHPTATYSLFFVREQDLETQRRVAEQVVRPRVRRMNWAVGHRRKGQTHFESASQRLVDMLDACSSIEECLDSLLGPVHAYLDNPPPAGKLEGEYTNVPLARFWCAAWLAIRGVILFPLTMVTRGYDLFAKHRYRPLIKTLLLRPEDRSTWDEWMDRVFHRFSPHTKKNHPRHHLGAFFIGPVLTQPASVHGRISPEALAAAVTKSRVGAYTNMQHALYTWWRSYADTLRSAGVSAGEIHQSELRVIPWILKRSDELWAWLNEPSELHPSNKFVDRTRLPAGPNLQAHAESLRHVFPEIAGLSTGHSSAQLGHWLAFLLSLDDDAVPPNVLSITSNHIVSIEPGRVSFVGWAHTRKIYASSLRNSLTLLKKAWNVANRLTPDSNSRFCPVYEHGVVVKNSKVRNISTTRRALDQEILDLLIAENRDNDFAFSRERGDGQRRETDNRRVMNSSSANSNSTWWPGPAVALDLLLQVPIRHRQGRFIDSGEGDEFVLSLDTLEYRENSLPTATKHRQQAFLRRVRVSSQREEWGLGMYVNTNKTGRDYEFPFLDESIARNIQRVIDWQVKHNPIGAPVSDRVDSADSAAGKAGQVEALMVYPVFRDPANRNNRPVSDSIVLSYFRALMRRVEQKYNVLKGTSLQFFDAAGDPIFDIHSLRVTGVTRLLDMGVPPQIVRALVGHASIIMTYYYEVLSNAKITRELNRALESRRPSREAMLEMDVEERTAFLDRLCDTNGSEKQGPKLIVSRLIEERSPFLDVRHDGICPGQNCAEAGVWRNQACGLCKHFITGAPFYAGLVLRVNGLMAEIIRGQQNIASLNERKHSLRDQDRPARGVEAEVAQQKEFVDKLVGEWMATVALIRRAEEDLSAWMSGDRNDDTFRGVALVAGDKANLEAQIESSHHLHLFTRLIEGAKQVQGFLPPPGVVEQRNEILLSIAYHEQRGDLFFRMRPALRRAALDQFGLLLTESVSDLDEMEDLVEGRAKLDSLPMLQDWFERVAGADTASLERLLEASDG